MTDLPLGDILAGSGSASSLCVQQARRRRIPSMRSLSHCFTPYNCSAVPSIRRRTSRSTTARIFSFGRICCRLPGYLKYPQDQSSTISNKSPTSRRGSDLCTESCCRGLQSGITAGATSPP